MPNHYRGVSKSAVCAVCGENKRAHTPVEDKQAFQIWHIYHPGTGYEQFCHLNGGEGVHSGTGGAERHVLHMVNCLAAGILRSDPPSVSSPSSNLQTQSSPAGPSPGCWVELSGSLWSPPPLRPSPCPLYPDKDVNARPQPRRGCQVRWSTVYAASYTMGLGNPTRPNHSPKKDKYNYSILTCVKLCKML